MHALKLIPFALLFACIGFAQEKITFADRLYCADMASTYYYVQGRFSWTSSNPAYGIQFKKLKSDNEAGVFTFFTGQTYAVNYTKLNGIDLLNGNIETHFRSFPLTAGLIRIGAGLDYTTNFHQTNIFSIYPSVGLDMGGIEITYAYLINSHKSSEISDHRITLAIGLWVKQKKLK